ncbi:MAG: protein kinase, partial [Pseudomonadota bacterium]
MNPSSPSEETLFANALARPTAERPAYLDEACAGNPALRTRLEVLLKAHDLSQNLLAGSPAAAARTVMYSPGPVEMPGTLIGRYKLLEQIGEGGFGTVYMAEQEVPVRRRVALKVIKLGMDTRSVIARFEAERQTLALMTHADIARVYDAGATSAGRPYFVMEYVEGYPITRFCDEHSLPMEARLELFSRVCLALQHA